ncbi:unnamed protein product [Prunus armeniaca]|uniref:Uncharacterized protein n=1 Tax=Prunus armeniaca TaxID=36596 RepID=A0A6J5WKB6_PRUAR|nr:unnamed protein product [Prunus armeniaca]
MPSGTLYLSPNATSPDEVKMSFLRSSLLEMALPLSTQTTDIPQISSLLQLVYLSYKSKNTQPPYQPYPFTSSLHTWEVLLEESECRVVSQDKVRKLQLIVLLFKPFEAGMEWAAGTKLKGSFTFLEASPSSLMIIIEVALYTEASATWMLESQVTILV